jgi:large subunit ribosomal protein L5e
LGAMAFVKVLKNKAYFKRFQVQRRRRREGKTDFKARRKMVRQDKNKYNNKKYRMIVRFTNTKCICQVAYATIRGDMIVASATSQDLVHFGIPCGFTNYAAAYATGLLCARRTLKKFGLDQTFKGKEEIDGDEYHVEDDESDQRPFKCILDVGLHRTCVGARLWGALKGAVDGGLHIPHTQKNFPGYTPPDDKGGESQFDAEAHKEKIFGGNVKEYMEMMQEEDPTKYEAHFSKFIAADIDADKLEDMYSDAHGKIRENPDGVTKEKKGITFTKDGAKMTGSDGTEHSRSKKIGLEARREKVAQKIAAAQARMLAEAEE